MVFKPAPERSRWEGLLALAWILAIDLVSLALLLARPVDWLSYLLVLVVAASLPLLAHLAYRTWGAFSLEYWLDRDALRIRWADILEVIPLEAIQEIRQGGQELHPRSGLAWPSPHVRSSTALGILRLERYATRPLEECLLLETPEAVFAVSPRRPQRFLRALEEHRRLGPAHRLAGGRERLWPALAELRRPLARWLLGAGLIGGLALLGVLMVSYPSLPERMSFPPVGEDLGAVDSLRRIRPKEVLFMLPTIGWVAYLLNGALGLWMALRRQWVGAYLLWTGTLVVQGMSLIALLRFVT